MTDFDEIDQEVDRLFREWEDNGSKPDDWRVDRIDEIIQDAYDEALWWHNNRISEGSDPKSGLRSLPYIPWYEPIDGVAAMMGNGDASTSFERNGGTWRGFYDANTEPTEKRGLTCGEFALICGVVLSLFVFMAVIWR